MNATIWTERHPFDRIMRTMRGIEAKGCQSFITNGGEAWRGGFIDARICYVLWAAGIIDRQEQSGHFITRPDTAERAYRFAVKYNSRTVPMSGRMIAREF